MAKKKSWFNLVKRFSIWDTQSKQEKKGKRRKWIFGRLRNKRLPSLTAPEPLRETTARGSEEEQSKIALTVAIASAAPAQVAGLTEFPQPSYHCTEQAEELEVLKARNGASQSKYRFQRVIRESVAI